MKDSRDINFDEELASVKARLPKTYTSLLEYEGFSSKRVTYTMYYIEEYATGRY